MTNEATAHPPGGLTPSLRTLVGLAAVVVVLVGLSLARDIVGPLAVAAVIVIICNPVRRPLERWGWPSWLATTAVIALSWSVLLVLALMLAYAAARFTDMVFEHYAMLYASARETVALFSGLGLDAQIAEVAAGVLSPTAIARFATQLGMGALEVLTALFFIFAYAIFMAADASRFGRAEKRFGPSVRRSVGRFASFNDSVRRYYVVNATFGLIVAVIDGLALWWLGVPAPTVWAILAFVTNFVPNIGFVLGLVPPAILAFVVGGWPLLLAVIAIYAVVNVVLQVLVQPKFVSDAVNLSLTLTFLSVLFWTFIIGPLGAILAIPLTLLLRALVLEGDPKHRWLRWLSGDDAVEPATR
ncbi:MAG: AI-2E family transporter [Candidatus Leucobacter sulfamidivorax]|nr:AI-2E family transporter [Candidatus Leucobacter sulfamidivorax]